MTENTLNDSSLYNFYQTNNLALARSIIIKNSLTAEKLNRYVPWVERDGRQVYVPLDNTRPETWRYYCHLAGEFHPYDTPMRVVSLDTLQEIDFTKENMKIHRATWRNYQLGTEYFNELVKRFPEQEMLIRGIINPIDKQTAINAKEYEILYYDPTLVDGNEFFLISELQQKIRNYLLRWDVAAYTLTDEYYEPMRMMILYMNIPSMLMNIRLKYANTVYANKYHIWNYLGSKLELDRYRAYLTTEQTMWLYKNINWLIAHAGKQMNFEEITEYVMSKRNLPISRFKIHRDLKEILNNNPDLEIERQQINLPNLDYKSKEDTLDLKKLMKKELPTALHNADSLEDYHDTGKEMWRFGKHDNINTKVIESHVEDYSTQEVFQIDDTLFDYWVYMACMDRYETIITVRNPSSAEALTLNTKEALIVFIYALWRSLMPNKKDDTGNIGFITAKDIYFPIMPKDEKLIANFWEKEHYDLYLRYIKEQYPAMGTVYSTEEFFKFCSTIHRFKYAMYDLWGFIQDQASEGEVHLLTNSLKADYVFPLLPEGEESYFSYCKERGWLIMNMTQDQYLELANEIFTKITGKDLTKGNTIESIQENMVRLMEKLSSYNIHFVKSINSQDVAVFNLPMVKVGIIEQEDETKYSFLKDKPMLLRKRQVEFTSIPLSMNLLSDENTIYDIEESTSKHLDIPVEIQSNHFDQHHSHHNYPTSVFHSVFIEDENEVIERSYWIRNGSLFSGEFLEYEQMDIVSLDVFRDEVWLTLENAILPNETPSPYDWSVFRERYGDKVQPNFTTEDGRLEYRKPIDESTLETLEDSYLLTGFEWNLGNIEAQPYPLPIEHRLPGFEMAKENFLVKEEYIFLRDIAEEILPGFEWGDFTVRTNLTGYHVAYISDPVLPGFTWEQRDERQN